MSKTKEPLIIAEVKTHSPFGWESGRTWTDLFELAKANGDWVSVHTDARWHGSFDLLKVACESTDKPVLAKGMHTTDAEVEHALHLGAHAVLVVGRVPADELLPHCLLEPIDFLQLEDFTTKLPEGQRLVWNSRDLASGAEKIETFGQARELWPGWLCQASNVTARSDIHESADAVLVGQKLPEFIASEPA